jgi:TRAP-type C4-dicarboxylate transport system substrate-binding protein
MNRLLALVALVPTLAWAEPHVLRIGTIIPDGSGFARETRSLGRTAEALDESRSLRIKYYWGAIAGDELQMAERVRRGQLDGVVSGGMLCEKLAPSLRVARIPGLFQKWSETSQVVSRLKAVFDKEMQQNGWVNVSEVVVGPSILFTRAPVATMADLGKNRLWIWDTDEMLKAMLPELGFRTVPLPIYDAAHAYDEGRVDGFAAPSAAALGFQWSALVHHYTDLKLGFVVACLVISNRAFDSLPLSSQRAIRTAAAQSQSHFQEVGEAQERELLGGLFRKQGVKPVEVSEEFRAAFFEAARAARERIAIKLVSTDLIQRVLGMLADYRSEHR